MQSASLTEVQETNLLLNDDQLESQSLRAPEEEINKRRNFAIISHPDAGKTTLTEKLLLFGGAIQDAGAVKARSDQRKATSDWVTSFHLLLTCSYLPFHLIRWR
jgi:hypothetical protein